ncbi:hypothetical protein ERHA55_37590 [Erwinia rhapontici]|nr:hypothetical protein ERHA55_37590 [Erwinia rhapontici]
MVYQADAQRYETMTYHRCGRSGLKLPAISLGLWHNFGDSTRVDNSRDLLRHAFDNGITHFDLANNYGPLRVRLKKILAASCVRISAPCVMNWCFPAKPVTPCGMALTATGDRASI